MCYLQQGVDKCRQTQASSTTPVHTNVSGFGNHIITSLPGINVKDVLCQGPDAFMSNAYFKNNQCVKLSFICILNNMLGRN